MKHLQKLVTIVLAFVLALSLSLTALAEEDYGQEVTGNDNLFQNNEAQTTFSVVAVPANLSATVPLNVTFAGSADLSDDDWNKSGQYESYFGYDYLCVWE